MELFGDSIFTNYLFTKIDTSSRYLVIYVPTRVSNALEQINNNGISKLKTNQ